MTKLICHIVFIVIVVGNSLALAAPVLEPVDIVPVDAVSPFQGLQPSGLASCNGKLLMVSDRHNHTVFELLVKDDKALAKPFLTVENIPKPKLDNYDFGTQWWANLSRRYDWEGISCQDNRLYLLSETLSQVLVIPNSEELYWLGDHTYQSGREKGLFEQLNAKAEGLAIFKNDLFIAAERQPRGIVRANIDQSSQTQAYYLNGFPDLLQPKDFAGLFATENALYSLERNHFQVCKREKQTLSVITCWSYEGSEKHPQWRYQDQRFGKAEGLTIHQNSVYIILDNNGDSRQAAPTDNRPLLMVFKIPDHW